MAFAASAPPLVGWASDRLSVRPDALVIAVVVVAVPAVLVAAVLLRWCEVNGFQRTADHAAQLDAAAT
jgi:hypothetical protein